MHIYYNQGVANDAPAISTRFFLVVVKVSSCYTKIIQKSNNYVLTSNCMYIPYAYIYICIPKYKWKNVTAGRKGWEVV